MKALVKTHAEKGLTLQDVPEPKAGSREVVIKVEKTGVCGTDLHIYNWDEWAQKAVKVPNIIGHEFVGRIVEIGNDVVDFSLGDLVSGEGHLVCGHCRNCMAGRRHLCRETRGVGVNHPGCFAEYITLPVTNLWEHHGDVDLEVASIFDPFGNAVHTAFQFPCVCEDVLVTGAGPIGIMGAAVVKHAGARHVVITDVNPKRLELARRLGIEHAFDVRETSLADVQKELGMEEGFDVGLEMSGNPQAFQDMIANMSHGGKISMLGIPSGPMNIDWNQVIFSMLTIKGVYGREMYESWYQMSSLLRAGLDIKPVITHRMDYKDFEKAFEVMNAGDCGKVVLDWNT
ncbi:L-threonine 3-dehydrogenase [Coraliomargarita sinensis]|uniref:L-threonine 3-dehydrogenase n=1 Tax=Coraliomargarita sinensis TaxID=2174842 RepID=A0A317ZM43_9BACT|nr:L-threonine 3-dehydrogenase [Coraliomargarita sinensis]PXA05303.1 L-threonine 3-dehydrogenase [Coraliomargarita sinensis]